MSKFIIFSHLFLVVAVIKRAAEIGTKLPVIQLSSTGEFILLFTSIKLEKPGRKSKYTCIKSFIYQKGVILSQEGKK